MRNGGRLEAANKMMQFLSHNYDNERDFGSSDKAFRNEIITVTLQVE